MQNTMKFYKKNVYGNEVMYLVDRLQRESIQQISHRKTITREDQFNLSMLGFVFVEITETEALKLQAKENK